MNKKYGYVRIAASVPELKVANVEFNVNEIIDEIIPHASEYYCGCLQDIEEHTNYVEKHFISEFPLWYSVFNI